MTALARNPAARLAAGWALATLVLAALGSDTLFDELSLWVIQGILALSLVVVWGHGGIFSLGQSGLYGLAGYGFGIVAVNLAESSWWLPLGVLAGAALAAVVAALVGYFIFYGRVSQINVAIITLATTLVLYAFVNNTADPRYHVGDAVIGGSNGLVGIPPAQLGGTILDKQQFFLLVMAVAGVCAVGATLLLRSPFGRIAAAVRSNEQRAELLGYDIRSHQLRLFVIGAVIAGIGGSLFAAWGSFIDPGVLALQPAILVVIWVIVGGRSYVAGAFAGAVGVEALDHYLGGTGGQYTPIYLGAALIAVVLLFPAGLLGALAHLRRRRAAAHAPAAAELGEAGQALRLPGEERPPATLAAVGVEKRYGGLHAVAGVDLAFPGRGIHSLIGPNGAGKSTLFALLTGTQRPTTGRILLDDRDITRMPPHRRARLGIGLKLQGVSLFSDLSARENLWLAAYSATRSRGTADRHAAVLCEQLGLGDACDLDAASLSHGQQQWLEIGVVIARQPSVILLDEPTAGMTIEETRHTAGLVRHLATQASVVIIEHDMAFIRALEAPVTVLHLGRVLTQGSLAEVERDERVLDVYLGRAGAGDHAPDPLPGPDPVSGR